MTDIEKKAALTLKPYFSKNPVIFDVGSNKGDWSNVLIHNVSEAHLFEPNLPLLHYSMIRFDTLNHATYNNKAVFSENKELDFFYFTNHNNGLSSVFYNQFWVDQGLPMQLGKCEAITLDGYWDKRISNHTIDFIKIDVEGADLNVLFGARQLLIDKEITFIQIEYSDHYKLSGHKFEEVPKFIRQFGYDLFHFDGSLFHKVKEPFQQYGAENFYIMDKDFTQDWNGEFRHNTQGIKADFVLEIGAFEGLTTTYICDNLLNPGGRVICIDPLTDEYLPGHKDNDLFVGQYDRFTRNTRNYPIELIREKSSIAFQKEGFSDYRFDLIYIDGNHQEPEVYNDGVNSFHLCKIGGHILFDDYEWREETKRGIDRFLSEYLGYYDLVIKGYQVMICKRLNTK